MAMGEVDTNTHALLADSHAWGSISPEKLKDNEYKKTVMLTTLYAARRVAKVYGIHASEATSSRQFREEIVRDLLSFGSYANPEYAHDTVNLGIFLIDDTITDLLKTLGKEGRRSTQGGFDDSIDRDFETIARIFWDNFKENERSSSSLEELTSHMRGYLKPIARFVQTEIPFATFNDPTRRASFSDTIEDPNAQTAYGAASEREEAESLSSLIEQLPISAAQKKILTLLLTEQRENLLRAGYSQDGIEEAKIALRRVLESPYTEREEAPYGEREKTPSKRAKILQEWKQFIEAHSTDTHLSLDQIFQRIQTAFALDNPSAMSRETYQQFTAVLYEFGYFAPNEQLRTYCHNQHISRRNYANYLEKGLTRLMQNLQYPLKAETAKSIVDKCIQETQRQGLSTGKNRLTIPTTATDIVKGISNKLPPNWREDEEVLLQLKLTPLKCTILAGALAALSESGKISLRDLSQLGIQERSIRSFFEAVYIKLVTGRKKSSLVENAQALRTLLNNKRYLVSDKVLLSTLGPELQEVVRHVIHSLENNPNISSADVGEQIGISGEKIIAGIRSARMQIEKNIADSSSLSVPRVLRFLRTLQRRSPEDVGKRIGKSSQGITKVERGMKRKFTMADVAEYLLQGLSSSEGIERLSFFSPYVLFAGKLLLTIAENDRKTGVKIDPVDFPKEEDFQKLRSGIAECRGLPGLKMTEYLQKVNKQFRPDFIDAHEKSADEVINTILNAGLTYDSPEAMVAWILALREGYREKQLHKIK